MPDHSSHGAESHYRVLSVACCMLLPVEEPPRFSKGKLLIWFCESTEPFPKTRKYAFFKKKMKRLDPDFFAFDSCLGDLSTDKNVEFAFLIIS